MCSLITLDILLIALITCMMPLKKKNLYFPLECKLHEAEATSVLLIPVTQ